MLLQSVHCVGLDCERGYLFDSSRPKVLRLTEKSLKDCGFTEFEPMEIREVMASMVPSLLVLVLRVRC